MNQDWMDNDAMLELLGQPPKGPKQIMGPYAGALRAPDPVGMPKPEFQKVVDPRFGEAPLPTSNTMPIAPVRETPSDAPGASMSTIASLLGGTSGTPITGTTGSTPKKEATSDAPVTGPPAATGGAPPTPPATGFTPRHAFEGFDFTRKQDPSKSAKDAFASLANDAPPPPLNDKAALGAWFNQYIAPGMNSLGHQIVSVNGDSFTFRNWQGEFTVDFGRGAGAEGGALAWQVTPGTGQPTAGAPPPTGGVSGGSVPLGGGGETAMDRILAEVAALSKGGGASPMDEAALMELLRA